ncbi:MAG: YihY family inner membrane protein [Deltaproteobacteria bacterium]|nr:YihY family inner membrane protein [Deltaproteobacteria bacterium]
MKFASFPKTVFLTIKRASRNFFFDDCFSRAAALAYATLFALIPITYFVVSMVGVFGFREEQSREVLRIILEQVLPSVQNETLKEFQDNIFFYVEKFLSNIRALNVIAIAVFLCTGVALLNTIEAALNAIWKVSSNLSLVDRILTFCAVIMLGPLSVALSIYLTARFNSLAGTSGVVSFLSLKILFIAPILVSWIAFLVLYFKLPAAKVRLRDAALGAFIAAILFETAKLGFAHYVSLSATQSKLYGVLATIPLFLFWLYVVWVVVLFGAEIAYSSGMGLFAAVHSNAKCHGVLVRARSSINRDGGDGGVCIARENGVGVVTFWHPKGNSLTRELLKALVSAISELGNNRDVKVIVLQSVGDAAFCAGASFKELQKVSSVESGKEFFKGFAEVILAIKAVDKFVIARVHGKTVGGGVGIVAACDYALALDDAAVRLSELSIGLGPFVVGPAIERKIGCSAFASFAIDAEWRSATWGKEVGLYVDTFSDEEVLDSAIEGLLEKLASFSESAMAQLKRSFWQGTDNWDRLLDERALISGELCHLQKGFL